MKEKSGYSDKKEIRKDEANVFKRLTSIVKDSKYIEEIRNYYDQIPIYANLRCGEWYFDKFDGNCYFKSTDGHLNNLQFPLSRLNLNIVEECREKNSILIVDSTRRGKQFPDSFTSTVPIFLCVLNRTVSILKKRFEEEENLNFSENQIDKNFEKNEESEDLFERDQVDFGDDSDDLFERDEQEKDESDRQDNQKKIKPKKDKNFQFYFDEENLKLHTPSFVPISSHKRMEEKISSFVEILLNSGILFSVFYFLFYFLFFNLFLIFQFFNFYFLFNILFFILFLFNKLLIYFFNSIRF